MATTPIVAPVRLVRDRERLVCCFTRRVGSTGRVTVGIWRGPGVGLLIGIYLSDFRESSPRYH